MQARRQARTPARTQTQNKKIVELAIAAGTLKPEEDEGDDEEAEE